MTMTLASFIFRFFLILQIMLSGWVMPAGKQPRRADWCQCVIFILNYLGIQQIPGEYWTASSLAEPDKSGITWMEYQGYSRRPAGELPETGDLLVLSGGAQVITEQSWNGEEHLVPVPVNIFTGHIGIVLNAEEDEKEGTGYYRINLLSANWGVNATKPGVIGSCFNVDVSEFLLEKTGNKAAFFVATDDAKIREREINRAKRWGMTGLTAGSPTTMDGFPISPEGFISYSLHPIVDNPQKPEILDVNRVLKEIDPASAEPGDVIFSGGTENPGLGVISAVGSAGTGEWTGEVVFMPSKGQISGPLKWQAHKSGPTWTVEQGTATGSLIRFFRYADLKQ